MTPICALNVCIGKAKKLLINIRKVNVKKLFLIIFVIAVGIPGMLTAGKDKNKLSEQQKEIVYVKLTCTNSDCRKDLRVVYHPNEMYYVTCPCGEDIVIKARTNGALTYLSLKNFAQPHYIPKK